MKKTKICGDFFEGCNSVDSSGHIAVAYKIRGERG
jgi:hypothetical protein